MKYRAVLFDLFDTLVLFHRERLPEIQVNGKTIRSTAGHLHAEFRRFAPDVELAPFVAALFWSWQEAERIRLLKLDELRPIEALQLLSELQEELKRSCV